MKPQPPANDELIDRTRALWEPRLGRDLTREEARRMIAEVAGFFGVLADWAHAEATAAANDTPPQPSASGAGDER